jgi:tetratricopeptide (TPR) repeat protein
VTLLHFILILTLAQGSKSVEALTQHATEDYRRGNFSAARDELRQALKEAPQNAVLWGYLGLADAKMNEMDSAINDFQKSLSLAPKNAETHFNLGLLYKRKGETNKALEMYRQGLALDANDPGANQIYASLLMVSERYQEAIAPLQRLAKMKGLGPSVQIVLTECYLKSGMRDLGVKEVQDFLESSNAPATDHFNLVKVLLENHEEDLAQKVLRHAVLVAPDSAETHAKLGVFFANKNQLEDAAQEMTRAVRLTPDSAEYSMELAAVLLLCQRYSSALDFLTSVKERFRKLPDYQYKVALAYYGLNLYPEAITKLDELAREHPEMDLVQYFLGNSYLAEGELSKPEPYYNRAIELNPTNPLYYKSLGTLLRRQDPGRVDEAIKALSKALSLDAEDVQAKLELALCYEEQRNYPQAESLLEEIVRRQPALLPAHVALARAYYRQKKKAEGDRERAIISRLTSEEQGKELNQTQPPSS